eukprot:ANDGO_08218.mRNA.1 CHD3-type chromatin-remodeling factor PICKLE
MIETESHESRNSVNSPSKRSLPLDFESQTPSSKVGRFEKPQEEISSASENPTTDENRQSRQVVLEKAVEVESPLQMHSRDHASSASPVPEIGDRVSLEKTVENLTDTLARGEKETTKENISTAVTSLISDDSQSDSRTKRSVIDADDPNDHDAASSPAPEDVEYVISMDPCPCSYKGSATDFLEKLTHERSRAVRYQCLVRFTGMDRTQSSWMNVRDVCDFPSGGQSIRSFENWIRRHEQQFSSSAAAQKFPGYGRKKFSLLSKSPELGSGLQLYDYQLEGLNFMLYNWSQGRNSVLADEMGLGKTLQIIAVFHELARSFGCFGPFVVVAPLVTLTHWERECRRAIPDLKAIVYYGSQEDRAFMLTHEIWHNCERRKRDPVPKFDILITTYETVIRDPAVFRKVPWKLLIVDEAHRLKSLSTKIHMAMSSLFRHVKPRILLTGTPLQNNLNELFSLLTFVDGAHFPNEAAFFEEVGDISSVENLEKLQDILRPYVIRRYKYDVDQTIATKEEVLIQVELTKLQKVYYKAVYDKNKDFLIRVGAGGGAGPSGVLNNIYMQLRKVCNHPYLIQGCEADLCKNIAESDTEARNEMLVKSCGKMQFLDKFLSKMLGMRQKVLVFSQMTAVLDIIEDYLNWKKYACVRLDGNTNRADRQAAIDQFQESVEIPLNADGLPDQTVPFVFLLSTRAGGLGITLTSSCNVVIYDSDWNPQNDLQAQARAHRIGQSRPVSVYRLVTKDTYEEYMLKVATQKLGLESVVMSSSSSSSAEESGNSDLSNSRNRSGFMEKLLRHGVFAILKDSASEQTIQESVSVDDLISKSARIVRVQDESSTSKGRNTLARASFIPAESVDEDSKDRSENANASKLDVDQPQFWQSYFSSAVDDPDSVIAQYKTIEEYLQSDSPGVVLDHVRDFRKWVSVLLQCVETLLLQPSASSAASSSSRLLKNRLKLETFLESIFDQEAHQRWMSELELRALESAYKDIVASRKERASRKKFSAVMLEGTEADTSASTDAELQRPQRSSIVLSSLPWVADHGFQEVDECLLNGVVFPDPIVYVNILETFRSVPLAPLPLNLLNRTTKYYGDFVKFVLSVGMWNHFEKDSIFVWDLVFSLCELVLQLCHRRCFPTAVGTSSPAISRILRDPFLTQFCADLEALALRNPRALPAHLSEKWLVQLVSWPGTDISQAFASPVQSTACYVEVVQDLIGDPQSLSTMQREDMFVVVKCLATGIPVRCLYINTDSKEGKLVRRQRTAVGDGNVWECLSGLFRIAVPGYDSLKIEIWAISSSTVRPPDSGTDVSSLPGADHLPDLSTLPFARLVASQILTTDVPPGCKDPRVTASLEHHAASALVACIVLRGIQQMQFASLSNGVHVLRPVSLSADFPSCWTREDDVCLLSHVSTNLLSNLGRLLDSYPPVLRLKWVSLQMPFPTEKQLQSRFLQVFNANCPELGSILASLIPDAASVA